MGFLFLDLYLPPPLPASASSHTTSSHTTLSHTHTPSLSQHPHTITWRHPPSFHVAGVALGDLGDIHLRFAWQAWYLWHLAGSGDALGPRWSPVTPPRHFAWQAWRLATSTFVLRGRGGTCDAWLGLVTRLVPVGIPWRRSTLRGRRGTWRHRFAWQAVHVGRPRRRATLRGRRGTWWHPRSLCVAGVALGDVHLHFAWQAWNIWHLAGSGDALGPRWSPVTPRRRATLRGRHGTWWHPPSFHMAGVALGDIHLRFAWQRWYLWRLAGSGDALGPRWSPVTPLYFAWQAWHLATSTVVSCGRRDAWRHPPSFCVAGVVLMTLGWVWWRAWSPLVARDAAPLCVAGVALGDTHLRFAWQAWRLATSTVTLRGHLSHTTLSHTQLHHTHTQICHTPSFTHLFVTHHLSRTTFSRTIFVTHHLSHTPSFAHIFVTHLFVTHLLSHTTLSHTFFHTPLCHTPSFTHHFVTRNFVTHLLSHTTLSHTIFHTHLCHTHTPSFTHHFVTHLLSHTALSHTFFDTPLCHTPFGTHNFVTPSFPHTTLSHTLHCVTPNFVLHNFVTHNCSHTTFRSILHHLLCLSFLPRPAWTFCVCLLEEVDLWGYPVL